MTEEQVTKAILAWLIREGWEIVCFDFPQSGTGKVLHSNRTRGEKNKDSIIPDIVAVKAERCVFFENKDRFYLPDYEKMFGLIHSEDYRQSIERLLTPYDVSRIFYGIGLPTEKRGDRAKRAEELVDFVMGVSMDGEVEVLHARGPIFD